MVVIWVVGVTSGMLFFESRNRSGSASMNTSSVLTSAYPPNSIEQIFMERGVISRGKSI
jgi:hypothetical protein